MSTLSVFVKNIGAWFSSFTHSDPAVQASMQGVGADLQAAGDKITAILPYLAVDAANAALAMVPSGLGVTSEVFVDPFIDAIVAQLLSRKSGASPVTLPPLAGSSGAAPAPAVKAASGPFPA